MECLNKLLKQRKKVWNSTLKMYGIKSENMPNIWNYLRKFISSIKMVKIHDSLVDKLISDTSGLSAS